MSEEQTAEKTSLTIRETELAVIALQALKNGKVDLDEDKFAQMAGYSNARSASVCFSNLKRKLNAATVSTYFVAAGTGGTPRATPKKPRAKSGAKSQVDTPIAESPTKRKNHPSEETTPSKRAKSEGYVKKEEDADEASAATENDAPNSEI
ncbi:MAG: hypothetical protein Q9221_004085 [Calogaya cf. arnoldii]